MRMVHIVHVCVCVGGGGGGGEQLADETVSMSILIA